jgi:hypothetical protein
MQPIDEGDDGEDIDPDGLVRVRVRVGVIGLPLILIDRNTCCKVTSSLTLTPTLTLNLNRDHTKSQKIASHPQDVTGKG